MAATVVMLAGHTPVPVRLRHSSERSVHGARRRHQRCADCLQHARAARQSPMEPGTLHADPLRTARKRAFAAHTQNRGAIVYTTALVAIAQASAVECTRSECPGLPRPARSTLQLVGTLAHSKRTQSHR